MITSAYHTHCFIASDNPTGYDRVTVYWCHSMWYFRFVLHFMDPFDKRFMSLWLKSYENTCGSYMTNIAEIKSQICTCHDSSAVVACENLWHDLIIRKQIRANWFHPRFQLWTHKPFVQRSKKYSWLTVQHLPPSFSVAFYQNCRHFADDIFKQTTFSNAFSRTKMFEFRLRFHWSLFLWFELTIFQHWFR